MMQDSKFGKTFFYEQIKAGRLPPPKKIGRWSRWEYRDYKDWKAMYNKLPSQESK
ncbi:excisionase [Symbiopectobacterium sp. Eva_TO]